jgi:hypothetical protein
MYSMVMARLDDAPLAGAIADVPGVKLLLNDAWKATVPVPEADKTTSDRTDELFMVGRAVLPLYGVVRWFNARRCGESESSHRGKIFVADWATDINDVSTVHSRSKVRTRTHVLVSVRSSSTHGCCRSTPHHCGSEESRTLVRLHARG